MVPSREDSQDLVVGRWSGGSSGTTRVQWSSPPPAESHSKEKFNKRVLLDPPWVGQGMQTMLSCWRHSTLCSARGQCPCCCSPGAIPGLWCTLPWEQCQATAALLYLACPDQIPPWNFYYTENLVEGSTQPHLSVQTSLIHLSCSTAGHWLCTKSLREQVMS